MFLNQSPKAKEIKAKINKQDLIKLTYQMAKPHQQLQRTTWHLSRYSLFHLLQNSVFAGKTEEVKFSELEQDFLDQEASSAVLGIHPSCTRF